MSSISRTANILMVEDDASLGDIMHERLCEEGFNVCWERNYTSAKGSFESNDFDVAIIDVNLPDGSGFDFAKWLKEQHAIPFIFLTAMNTAENRLLGYEIGAEEYIPKPFHFQELLIRLNHVLKEHGPAGHVDCPVGQIDLKGRSIVGRDGLPLKIAAREFEVLKLLIESAPSVVSRDDILSEVWGEEKFPTNRTIDNIVSRLRQIIDDVDGKLIRSVRSVGYQWTGARVRSKK